MSELNEIKKEFTFEERIAIYKDYLHTFGIIKQSVVALEELCELGKEIAKRVRGYENHKQMIEEIADVEIILEELKYYYKLPQESIDSIKTFKLNRMKISIDYKGDINELL